MGIWSWIIVSLIALIAILIVIETILQQKKERARISTLFAVLYQTKEYIRFVSTFHDHSKKIKKELPQINERDLVQIYISLLRKSSALATVTYLRAEKIFDYIKNTSFANTAMLNEDRDLIEDFLNIDPGNDHDNYNIDLYDDRLDPIRKIIKEETNKIAVGNI